MVRSRSIAALILACCASAPAPASASVIDWLNQKVEKILDVEQSAPAPQPKEYNAALKFLDSKAPVQRPQAAPRGRGTNRGATARSRKPGDLRLAFQDALRMDSDELVIRHFAQQSYEVGVWGLSEGFTLPDRLLGVLEQSIAPNLDLIELFVDSLKQRPEKATLDRVTTTVERLMLQVQSSHQLLVEVRTILEEGKRNLDEVDLETSQMVAKEGTLGGEPEFIALTQIVQKGVGNMESTLRNLGTATDFFKRGFQAATSEMGHLERISNRLAYLTRDRVKIGDRKEDMQTLFANVYAIRDSLREVKAVLETTRKVIEINKQGLMHLILTLDRPGAGGQAAASRGRDPRVADMTGITSQLERLNERLPPHPEEREAALLRVADWVRQLRDFKASPLVLEPLPRWVLTRSTLPGRIDPEEEPLADASTDKVRQMLDLLEHDTSGHDLEQMRARQQSLDDDLGDMPARRPAVDADLPPPPSGDWY